MVEIPNEVPNSTTVAGRDARTREYSSLPLSGSTGWNYYDRKGGRAQARWQPFDGFTADVAYDYAEDDNTPQYSQLLNYNPNHYNVGTFTNPTTGVVGTSLFFGGVGCNTSNGAGG